MKKNRFKRLRLCALMLIVCLMVGCARQSVPPFSPTQAPAPTNVPLPVGQAGDDMVVNAPVAPPDNSLVAPVNNMLVVPGQQNVPAPPLFNAVTDNADLSIAMVAVNGSGFNPFSCNARDITSLLTLVFESVVELNDSLQPTALLATGWSNEGDVYTFSLREDIRFHNGAQMTAYDVYASYEAIQMAGSFSPYFSRIRYIRSMTVVDDYTLQVEGQDCGYMTLYAMTFPVASQLSLASEFLKGTGPYWFAGSDTNGNVRLERNPLWWKRQSNLQAVVGIRYDSDAQALTALETNEVDCVATRSSAAALSRQLSDRSTLDYSTLTWECLLPNLENSIVGELPVRQAIMYAVNRSSLANTTYLGIVQESEVPVIPGSFLYEPQSTQFNYNPERALQILYDAGWQDTNGDGILDRIKNGLWEDLAFEIVTYDEPGAAIRTEAIEAIAQQLNRVGFNVSCTTVSKTRMTNNLAKGSFALALIAYNLSEVPDLTFMLDEKGKGNYSGYASPQMDELLERVKGSEDESAFLAAMHDVQMLIVNDLPVMGLFFRTGVLVSNHSLAGLSGSRESQILRGLQYMPE